MQRPAPPARDTSCTGEHTLLHAPDGGKMGDLVQACLGSQTHWSPYLHDPGSKWTLNVSPMCEEGSNSRHLYSFKVQLLILPGPRDELWCNLIRLQQYSMRTRDNTLTANGLEHQLQFHCTLGKTHTVYLELTTPTEARKSLQGLSPLHV